ncbi:MAG TPA: NAD(P)-dependent oxidoreductase [Candidatus Brocadiia bacterium]|nr:NAD(P)-dependent oxidoreductase [Candidatus Brocadiia bacterium]
MDENIGFIGTGVMGASMAGHLLQAGKKLSVFSRTRAKAEPLLSRGAAWADSPAALAKTCDVVFTIVGFPKDVEEVYLGASGLVANMRPGALLVDMTTSRPDLAVRIASAAAEREGQAIDAPVSGGDKGAREATLTIMVGGGREAFDRALPLLQIMGKNIVHQGPAGSGQHCKMCNQIAIACNMIGVCEAMAYARKAGLDPENVLKSIGAGAAASWSLSHLAPRMLKGDFAPGFYVKHFIKDMSIAAESADQMALDTPGLDLALALYRKLAAQGGEDSGTQALCKLYA